MTYPQYPPFVQINPWAQLWACRIGQRSKHRHNPLTATLLRDSLIQLRQDFLGTDIGLTMFVRDMINGRPNEGAVEEISEYLGKRINYFLQILRPTEQPMDQTEIAVSVMRYGLLLYAYDRVGQDKLDDLIRWAECYADNPEVMAIVVEDDLPEDLSDECWEFVSENEVPPGGFVDATTAAVAVMTGALKDPFNETI